MSPPNAVPITSKNPAPASATPRVSKMTLANVVKGVQKKPFRVALYGPEGVGKSTFAAGAPDPIFLGAEDGTARLDVARLQPESWDDVLDAIRMLILETHSYKTFVLDTLDWAEPMVWRKTCERGDEKGRKKARIEDFGYGKGYNNALYDWQQLTFGLQKLQEKKDMNVILLAHAQIETFKNPVGDDYDRYSMKLHKRASGLIREWCEDVLFCRIETFRLGGDDSRKAASDGARIVHTEWSAPWDAKNRNSLPAQLPLSWFDYEAAAKAHVVVTPERLIAKIEELLPHMNGKTETAKEFLAKAGQDAVKLARLRDWCLANVQIESQEGTDTTNSNIDPKEGTLCNWHPASTPQRRSRGSGRRPTTTRQRRTCGSPTTSSSTTARSSRSTTTATARPMATERRWATRSRR